MLRIIDKIYSNIITSLNKEKNCILTWLIRIIIILISILFLVNANIIECAEKIRYSLFWPDTGKRVWVEYTVRILAELLHDFAVLHDLPNYADREMFDKVYELFIAREKLSPIQKTGLTNGTFVDFQYDNGLRYLNTESVRDNVYRYSVQHKFCNVTHRVPESLQSFVESERTHLSVDRFFMDLGICPEDISTDMARFVGWRYEDAYIYRVGEPCSRLRYEAYLGRSLTGDDRVALKDITRNIVKSEVKRVRDWPQYLASRKNVK